MVRLSKIYTKTGDDGTTMLGDGNTVPKHTLRVEAYGTVDEANATIGMALASFPPDAEHGIKQCMQLAQHDLFDCGADLCVPVADAENDGDKLRIEPAQIQRLEQLIDAYNAPLKPLSSFVLPGGSVAAAHLHLARTAVRRAERLVAKLVEQEPDATNNLVAIYLNRLSDLLFVLARRANDDGDADVAWEPGKTRPTGPGTADPNA
jgi:cob(I)alamin adenosyltransferase